MTFVLTNTGHVAASEVAQLYLGFPESAGEPPSLLRGFMKAHLKPGVSKSIQFELRERDLSIWDEASHAWSKILGVFNVSVGASSRDLRQTITLNVSECIAFTTSS